MQSSKEQQGEIRKTSSVINAKKQRKTIEWQRLETSSRKLDIPKEHFMQDGHNKGLKWYGPNRSRRFKKWQEYTKELYKKDLHDPDNHDGVYTEMQSQVGLRKHHYEQS